MGVVGIEAVDFPEQLAVSGVVARQVIGSPGHDGFDAIDFQDLWSGVGVAGLGGGFVIAFGAPDFLARFRVQGNQIRIAFGLHDWGDNVARGDHRGAALVPPKRVFAVDLGQIDLPELFSFERKRSEIAGLEVDEESLAVGDRR